MEFNADWFQEHLLSILAVAITLILIYYYLIERESGIKLSKKYRNSIFEAQSKIFLNATQYLISGNRDLAIKEFLNAVDLNRETIETYFALGGLFRSNGEIEKAISIHRSLIARENISESTRLEALKELAYDFDKGGFLEKAIETYKDCLKINRDQQEVIESLCRIFEDLEDWDQAYQYRVKLSKVSHENQSETISHILVQKAKKHFQCGEFANCNEELDDAFRYAPSVSAKILSLKMALIQGNLEDAKVILLEILREYPEFASFIFVDLREPFQAEQSIKNHYQTRLEILQEYFLAFDDPSLLSFPSLVFSKVRLLKESSRLEEAYAYLQSWMQKGENHSEALRIEFVKLLILLGKNSEALEQVQNLFQTYHMSVTRHFCRDCGYNSDNIFWRCPQCKAWETIQFRWKV